MVLQSKTRFLEQLYLEGKESLMMHTTILKHKAEFFFSSLERENLNQKNQAKISFPSLARISDSHF